MSQEGTEERRLTLNIQQEHVISKYLGTGFTDIKKHEWLVHQHRDTYASNIGHPSMLMFISVSENESISRVKFNMLNRMVQPCGPPPPRKDEF
ncbi:splicing factor 3b subunit 5 [Anaeramoeba flamelloides]|uniref:Splicing factor 3b subunit n=1 Tax=Anaeramoeba flamelloides TaxID=1746091 RepID=A0AAV8A5I8_9EUKA|nr:splicing factor 3b subunit [Anaeramoeba flamelloides]KAJ3448999.1 splicing factor 3b subunit [Anaeramoeba flamelloides]KAJ3449581.1 splicing factor 3b subunit [Anaeramoeba flamelloides]KAJ6232566.1 splicing factor 3b subunit 5 [Anaeramoeba flamelloides]KAJ6236023.1 splicing factor 3b subunit 5 [Anaeramoeba flamelloides]